jgi:hypothetical protein
MFAKPRSRVPFAAGVERQHERRIMMAYGDRMTMRIRDFGKSIEITVQRGKIEYQGDKKAIIKYHDSPVRNLPRGEKARKK